MKNDKLIFTAQTRLSFGRGSQLIEFVMRGNFLMFRKGEPQTGAKNEWGIEDFPHEGIKSIEEAERNIEVAEYLERLYKEGLTHVFKNNSWHRL